MQTKNRDDATNSNSKYHTIPHVLRPTCIHKCSRSTSMCARRRPTHARALAKLPERTPTLQHAVLQNLDPGPLFTGVLPLLRALHTGMEKPDRPGAAGWAQLRGVPHFARMCVDADTPEVLVCMRYCATLRVAASESIVGVAPVRVVRAKALSGYTPRIGCSTYVLHVTVHAFPRRPQRRRLSRPGCAPSTTDSCCC